MRPIKLSLAIAAAVLSFSAYSAVDYATLQSLTVGQHRSPQNVARNEFRHPIQTLNWLGIEPNMTVVEIWPGGGWYAEILAPYLRDNGQYYAAGFVTDAPGTPEYRQRVQQNFVDKLAATPAVYDQTMVSKIGPPNSYLPAPAGSADAVVTFRNVHNWIKDDTEQRMFASFFAMLKPGGILGVVEHRAAPGTSLADMKTSGYVTEAYVINIALKAGFELVESTAINANPADTHQHPAGVWTLLPSLRLKDQDREKYLAIGESDRMTLKFLKIRE